MIGLENKTTVLTTDDAEECKNNKNLIYISSSLKQYVCFLSNKKLFVSTAHQWSQEIKSLKKQLMTKNIEFNVVPSTPEEIANEYNNHNKNIYVNTEKQLSTAQQTILQIFTDAANRNVSDVHIEVKENATHVYFRINGDMILSTGESERESTNMNKIYSSKEGETWVNTIYQTMCDIADAVFNPREQQDARISDINYLPNQLTAIRVGTTPNTLGVLMVLRLLYKKTLITDSLRKLGYNDNQSKYMKEFIYTPTGIFIIGGPTGSGKSTTLQLVITEIDRANGGDEKRGIRGRLNIITVEDPPEYQMPAVQTPVANVHTNEERARAYNAAIKASLRLDPDVIMIGEIRDGASASSAIEAAMTGHQVWTTLHVNNAFACIPRLKSLGIRDDLLFSSETIKGLICQRLVKKLCEHCKEKLVETNNETIKSNIDRILQVAGNDLNQVYITGKGCEKCKNGISGRLALVEIVKTNEDIMNCLKMEDIAGAKKIWQTQQQGITLKESAIEKIKLGVIDPFAAEDIVGRFDIL